MHRDISILYHAYHADSRSFGPILDKFEITDKSVTLDDVNPTLGRVHIPRS